MVWHNLSWGNVEFNTLINNLIKLLKVKLTCNTVIIQFLVCMWIVVYLLCCCFNPKGVKKKKKWKWKELEKKGFGEVVKGLCC